MSDSWSSIKAWFSDALSDESKLRTFAMIQPVRSGDSGGEPLTANECYVKVTLARMQLRDSRFLYKEYYPLVHSFVELSRQGSDRVTVPFIAGPAQLAELGEGAEDRILAENIDLIGPTPYIGGNVNVAVGLCAAQAKDYLDNLLGVLGSISGVVGGTALTGALDVIEPLKKGAQDLLGMSEQVELKVGLINGFGPTEEPIASPQPNPGENLLLDGYYALINVDESANYGPWLHFRDNQLSVEFEGGVQSPVEEDHLVLRISQHETMPDWSRFPALNEARNAVLNAAINDGIAGDNYREQFAAFKRAVVTNADLVKADRIRIIKGLESEALSFSQGEAPVELQANDPARTLAAMAAKGPTLEEARRLSLDTI